MARRATSLGPKPSFFEFVSFFSFFSFLSLLLIEKNCFPPRKGLFLFIFECLPLFLLSLFWPPPFSISLSLSLSSSFLLVFLLVFYCFLLIPCFSLFLSFFFLLCFGFMKGTTSKKFNCNIFWITLFSFSLVSFLFSSFGALFLIFAFS